MVRVAPGGMHPGVGQAGGLGWSREERSRAQNRPRPGEPPGPSPAFRAPPQAEARLPSRAPPHPRTEHRPPRRISADLHSTPPVDLAPPPPRSFTNQNSVPHFQAAGRGGPAPKVRSPIDGASAEAGAGPSGARGAGRGVRRGGGWLAVWRGGRERAELPRPGVRYGRRRGPGRRVRTQGREHKGPRAGGAAVSRARAGSRGRAGAEARGGPAPQEPPQDGGPPAE